VSDYEMPPTEVRIASLDNQIADLARELAEKRKDRARFVAKLRRERLSRAPGRSRIEMNRIALFATAAALALSIALPSWAQAPAVSKATADVEASWPVAALDRVREFLGEPASGNLPGREVARFFHCRVNGVPTEARDAPNEAGSVIAAHYDIALAVALEFWWRQFRGGHLVSPF
jgi:hypothetical protein